jgi:AcrR family transcriptional regulator
MGRRPTYDRVEALQAATALFQDRGYHRVSVKDMVEATGINRFAIYEKFGGKEGLFYETLDYYHQVIVKEQLLGPLRRDDASIDTLLRMLNVVRDINKDKKRRSGCLIVNANIELGGLDERVAKTAVSVIDSFRKAATHTLRCADQAGCGKTGKSPKRRADHIAIQIQAFFALAYISRNAADSLITSLIDEVESWRQIGSRKAS